MLRLAPIRGCARAIVLVLLCCWLSGSSLPGKQAEKPTNQALQFEDAGERALAQGNYPVAAEKFRSALKLNPGSVEAHAGLGIALRESGNLGEAIVELQKAIELDPKGWKPRYRKL